MLENIEVPEIGLLLRQILKIIIELDPDDKFQFIT
jgi:hypothetical protein